jgi:formylglycine-generating enzyme required for sulfatase activity
VYSVTGIDWDVLAYSSIPTIADRAWNATAMDTSKNGYRLPTEMEWMWAAMGADTTSQPNTTGYSKDFAGWTQNIGNYAWYGVNAGGKTHEVGKKEANELGLRDMSGNVLEWCWDWKGLYPLSGGEKTDYTGVGAGAGRVNRSGSWIDSANFCTVAYRVSFSPYNSCNYLGFRVVCPE